MCVLEILIGRMVRDEQITDALVDCQYAALHEWLHSGAITRERLERVYRTSGVQNTAINNLIRYGEHPRYVGWRRR